MGWMDRENSGVPASVTIFSSLAHNDNGAAAFHAMNSRPPTALATSLKP